MRIDDEIGTVVAAVIENNANGEDIVKLYQRMSVTFWTTLNAQKPNYILAITGPRKDRLQNPFGYRTDFFGFIVLNTKKSPRTNKTDLVIEPIKQTFWFPSCNEKETDSVNNKEETANEMKPVKPLN